MQLILTIEDGPQPEMSGRTWRCGVDGGTLGRNPDCDLVLPDPKRYTSSVHAQIEFDRDGFTLTDRSTNGTYHNSPKTLIGKNRSVSLDQDDKIFIGDFVLRVDVEDADSDDASAQPGPDATSQFDDGFDDEFDDREARSDEPAMTDNDDSRPWDNSEFSLPWDADGTEPGAEDAGGSSDQDDEPSFSQSPEREYFAAPSASGGGDAIPDDWDDFLTGFHDPAKMRKPDPTPDSADEDARPADRDSDSRSTPGAGSEPAPDPESGDADGGSTDPGGKPFAEVEPDEHERFEPPSEPTPPPRNAPGDEAPAGNSTPPPPQAGTAPDPAETPAPASRAASTPESASKSPGDAPARTSAGAGHVSDDSVREILQVVTQGLMGLLQGRAEIKNEFRIAQTRFVQTENNPLKFSPNADEALKRILAEEESPGFLTGKRAFEDAFDDIQAHQLAILSAVQRAIESAVAQFDPAQIEKKLERISPLSARTPGLKAAKCWNLFSLHYEEVASKMREDARQLFLAEFAEAYEEACRAVAESKRKTES